MPWKSDKTKSRLCKWCDNPQKKQYTSSGVFKGYLRTCGSPICLSRAYKDSNVRMSKRFHAVRCCESCKKEYEATSFTQRWCVVCSPDRKASTLLSRYGVSRTQWNELFNKQNGKCFLCNEEAKVVDHDHETGKVRSLLCYGCNLLVGLLERDRDWITRGLNYIS